MGKKVKKKAKFVSSRKDKKTVPVNTQNFELGIQKSDKEIEGVEEDNAPMLQIIKTCRHVANDADLEKVSPVIENFENMHCGDCRVSERNEKRSEKAKGGEGKYIWICLQCGNLACGDVDPRSKKGHVFRHWQVTKHPNAVRWGSSPSSWCLPCGNVVHSEVKEDAKHDEGDGGSEEKIQQVLQLIKTRSRKSHQLKSAENGHAEHLKDGVLQEESGGVSGDVKERDDAGGYTVRGLTNLGNTCFFNSVMQNLLALEGLREYFLKSNALAVGPLNAAMKKLYHEACADVADRGSFKDQRNGFRCGGTINPKIVFNNVCSKAPQFRGYQQQDSHELLRFLLDGLHTEQVAYRKTSNAHFGESLVSEDADSARTVVDHLFGGQLSSRVSCLECDYSSVIHEPFLDLSLSIPKRKVSLEKAPVVSNMKRPTARSSLKEVRANKDKRIQSKRESVNSTQSTSSGNITNGYHPDQNASLSSDIWQDEPIIECKPSQSDDFAWMDFLGLDSVSDQTSCNLSLNVTEDSQLNEKFTEGDDSGTKCDVPNIKTFNCKSNHFLEQKISVSSAVEQNGSIFEEHRSSAESCSVHEEPLGDIVLSCSEHGSLPNGKFADSDLQLDDALSLNLVEQAIPNGYSLDTLSDGIACSSKEPVPSEVFGENSLIDEPPLVNVPEVILLPYTDYGFTMTDVPASTAAPHHSGNQPHDDAPIVELNVETSSFIAETDDSCFDGFGGLFNEPETVSESGRVSNGSQLAISSDSDEEELDDTSAEVTMDVCLADFVKPELLTREWICENCSKVADGQEMFEREVTIQVDLRDTVSKSMENGGCFQDKIVGGSSNGSSRSESLCNGHPESDSRFTKPIVETVSPKGKSDTSSLPQPTQANVCESSDAVPNHADNGLHSNQANRLDLRKCLQLLEGSADDFSMNNGISSGSCECDDNTFSSAAEVSQSGIYNDKDFIEGHFSKRKSRASSKVNKLNNRQMNARHLKIEMLKRDAKKRFLINKAPLVLTVHFKRFNQDTRGRLSKLSGHIKFQEKLDLEPYMDKRCGEKGGGCNTYHLVGVVEHSGTMRGGHYISYVRGQGRRGQSGDAWYYTSDSHVREVSLKEVLSSEAYILFYERDEQHK